MTTFAKRLDILGLYSNYKEQGDRKKKKILLAILSIAMVGVLGVAAVGCGEDKMTDTITVITRESGSGTRGAFIELTGRTTEG